MSARPVVVCVVTHRRPDEIERLLRSLGESSLRPTEVIISDHAPDGTVAGLAAQASLPVRVLSDPSNPGPGAGWANAAAARESKTSDLIFMDDDIVPGPTVIERLVETLRQASVAVPILTDQNGRIWGFPEPTDRRLRKSIREAVTPSDALRLLGRGPHRFCWATGACVAVRSELYEEVGGFRRDFWMLGEDLELTMRLAARGEAVFLADVVVPHLPPAGNPSPAAARIKFCSLLQNLSYLSLHSPHSRHLMTYLPGNFRRYFRDFGVSRATIHEALTCFVAGSFLAQPAGGPHGQALRERIRNSLA